MMIILLPFDRADSVDTFRAQNDCFSVNIDKVTGYYLMCYFVE